MNDTQLQKAEVNYPVGFTCDTEVLLKTWVYGNEPSRTLQVQPNLEWSRGDLNDNFHLFRYQYWYLKNKTAMYINYI